MSPEELRKLLKRAAVIGAFFGLALLFYFLRWTGALTFYVIVVTVLMVGAILIQSGRGGGLASLGGIGGESLLGTRSATPISKATYVMGALFIFICMLVSRMSITERANENMLIPGVEEQEPGLAEGEALPGPEGLPVDRDDATGTGSEAVPPSQPESGGSPQQDD